MLIYFKSWIVIYMQVFIFINFITAHQISDHNIYGYKNDNLEFQQQFDILPDYKLQRYVFPEIIPLSVNEIDNTDLNSTAIYRLIRKDNDEFDSHTNDDDLKRAILIRDGFLCYSSNCEIDKLRITLAYLLVDQNYDVWLGIKNFDTTNQTENTATENDETNKLAQYILSTTKTSELVVMNYSNDSTHFFTITSNAALDDSEESKVSQWWSRVKNWVKDTYSSGKNYITDKYEAGVSKVSEIGKKLDDVIENEAIKKIKEKILNAYGVVSSLFPRLKTDILSKLLDHPDIYLNTEQIIRKYGYNVEVHEVITEDGYILTLHRISGGTKYPPAPGKRVVYLQHGLLCSSACWILTGPTHGLGYLLADENYDVWMGNSRGSTYSRAHVNMTTTDSAFWDFSFHEIGIYDLPASIDYILNQTEEQQLSYIGHSQGTTVFFVLLSERPEYNAKVDKFIAFAPVAYVGNIESPIIQIVAPAGKRMTRLMHYFQMNEFLPSNSMITRVGRQICEARSVSRIFCTSVLSLLNGYDLSRIDKSIVPVLMRHLPAGCSTKQIAHFIQEINSKKFRKFDYGSELNMQIYGQSEPLDYKIDNILVPVALFYGPNDLLSTSTDVHRLCHELINLKVNSSVPFSTFNHLDFIFGTNAPELIYRPAIDFLKFEEA